MQCTLIFPDGVSLAKRDEVPGPAKARNEDWARIECANITPGFVLKSSGDRRFAYYAEANVNAPMIWVVFRELSELFLGPHGTLVFADKDGDPGVLGSDWVPCILSALEAHKYQLQHDGYLQFGIVTQTERTLAEVFVAPTKHFKVWLTDDAAFRAVMTKYGLAEATSLEFIDEYPHVTTKLSADRVVRDVEELARLLAGKLRGDHAH